MQNFLTSTRAYLTRSEPLMAPTNGLNDEQISELKMGAEEVSAGIRILGQEYYIKATEASDLSNKQLNQLNGYMRLFIALLVVTGGLVIGLLVRSVVRTNALWMDAQHARSELANTVDELRSGRREHRAKDSFIAAATHDLRQPLHALGLFLNSLRTEVSPNGERALTEAIQCTEALNRLFNSMLDLSRLDAGVVSVVPENFDLQQLLQTLHSELRADATAHGVTLSVNCPPAHAYTDPILLGRIVRNLIDNAISHSEASELVIDTRPVRNGHELIVADNGRGIPADEQKAIFSEYYQIGNPERDRSKGLGLGLSIVRRLSDLLGVQLSLDSGVGKGTRFTMVVAAGKVDKKPVKQRTIPRLFPQEEKPVIVVIDDDASILEAMQITLKQLDMTPICAESVDGALDALADASLAPDLIIADYRLRNNEIGSTAIHTLREAVDCDVPALVITGDTAPQRVSEATSTEFELLHKPVEADELLYKIRQMLQDDERA